MVMAAKKSRAVIGGTFRVGDKVAILGRCEGAQVGRLEKIGGGGWCRIRFESTGRVEFFRTSELVPWLGTGIQASMNQHSQSESAAHPPQETFVKEEAESSTLLKKLRPSMSAGREQHLGAQAVEQASMSSSCGSIQPMRNSLASTHTEAISCLPTYTSVPVRLCKSIMTKERRRIPKNTEGHVRIPDQVSDLPVRDDFEFELGEKSSGEVPVHIRREHYDFTGDLRTIQCANSACKRECVVPACVRDLEGFTCDKDVWNPREASCFLNVDRHESEARVCEQNTDRIVIPNAASPVVTSREEHRDGAEHHNRAEQEAPAPALEGNVKESGRDMGQEVLQARDSMKYARIKGTNTIIGTCDSKRASIFGIPSSGEQAFGKETLQQEITTTEEASAKHFSNSSTAERSCELYWNECLSVSDREALIFYKRLMKTYGATGSELPTWAASRCPNINGTPIFLYELYSIVTGLGGHEKVSANRAWSFVADSLGLRRENSPKALPQLYKEFLVEFEQKYFSLQSSTGRRSRRECSSLALQKDMLQKDHRLDEETATSEQNIGNGKDILLPSSAADAVKGNPRKRKTLVPWEEVIPTGNHAHQKKSHQSIDEDAVRERLCEAMLLLEASLKRSAVSSQWKENRLKWSTRIKRSKTVGDLVDQLLTLEGSVKWSAMDAEWTDDNRQLWVDHLSCIRSYFRLADLLKVFASYIESSAFMEGKSSEDIVKVLPQRSSYRKQ